MALEAPVTYHTEEFFLNRLFPAGISSLMPGYTVLFQI